MPLQCVFPSAHTETASVTVGALTLFICFLPPSPFLLTFYREFPPFIESFHPCCPASINLAFWSLARVLFCISAAALCMLWKRPCFRSPPPPPQPSVPPIAAPCGAEDRMGAILCVCCVVNPFFYSVRSVSVYLCPLELWAPSPPSLIIILYPIPLVPPFILRLQPSCAAVAWQRVSFLHPSPVRCFLLLCCGLVR